MDLIFDLNNLVHLEALYDGALDRALKDLGRRRHPRRFLWAFTRGTPDAPTNQQIQDYLRTHGPDALWQEAQTRFVDPLLASQKAGNPSVAMEFAGFSFTDELAEALTAQFTGQQASSAARTLRRSLWLYRSSLVPDVQEVEVGRDVPAAQFRVLLALMQRALTAWATEKAKEVIA